MVYEAVVERAYGETGTISIDVEAGTCAWMPGADPKGASASGGDADGDLDCGCLTWSGAPALPMAISREALVGASVVENHEGDASGDAARPAFHVWHAVRGERGGRPCQRILRSQPFLCNSTGQVDECVGLIRAAAGVGLGGRKKCMVVVNPVSGQARGLATWRDRIRPAFDAAGLAYGFAETDGPLAAQRLGASLDLDAYDGIVVVGGDGTLHEAIEGLFLHRSEGSGEYGSHPASHVALAVVPTGSGNGFAASTGAIDVDTAVWMVLKNRRAPLDLCSVLQPREGEGEGKVERAMMVLSTTLGFVAHLDLNTEGLRWMGPARFTCGAVLEVLKGATTQARVAVLPSGGAGEAGAAPPNGEDADVPAGGMACPGLAQLGNMHAPSLLDGIPRLGAPLSPTDGPGEGEGEGEGERGSAWRMLPEDAFQFFVLANTPCISLDDRVCPTLGVGTGGMALLCSGRNGRARNVAIFDALQNGSTHTLAAQEWEAAKERAGRPPRIAYHEVRAVAIDCGAGALVSLDGERFPTGRILVEVHPALGTCLLWEPGDKSADDDEAADRA